MRRLFNLFPLLLFAILASACDRRDPQAEYEQLRDAVYSIPRAGVDKAQEYIDHFHSKKGNRVTEVSEIRDQFRLMENFFSHSFRTYQEFMSQSEGLNGELSYSNYEGVRNTWKSLYGQERNRLLAPLMESINDLTFDSFFKTQVKNLCDDKFATWNFESIDQLSLSTPIVVRDGTVKESSGVYRVHLRGGIIGIRTSTAMVSISGRIGVDPRGELVCERTGYEFTESPLL